MNVNGETSPARTWLGNPFNQVIVAVFVPCPECSSNVGIYCDDDRVAGQYVHNARVVAGMAALREELILLAGT